MDFFSKKFFEVRHIEGKWKRLRKKIVNLIFSSDLHWIISCGMTLLEKNKLQVLIR